MIALERPVSEDPESVKRSDSALRRHTSNSKGPLIGQDCGLARVVLRRQSFLTPQSPLPCLCLIYPRRLPSSLPLTHTLTHLFINLTSNSDSFRCSFRDTCDTHHIHSLTFNITLDNRSLPQKHTQEHIMSYGGGYGGGGGGYRGGGNRY